MTLSAILDECLHRLQAGETVAACLALYPDQASELAPLLAAAARLRPLAGQSLSAGQHAQGRAAVREAAHGRAARTAKPGRGQRRGWLAGWAFGRAVAAIAVVLVLALAGTTVLASQPGDSGYALRVLAERAPAALQSSPGRRVDAELRIADRRLADLESHLRTTRRVEAAALTALVRGDEAAARRAVDLPEIERTHIAERIERHAAAIFRLAARAETPAVANRLQQVARRMTQVATRLRLGQPPPPQQRRAGLAPQGKDTATTTARSSYTPRPSLTSLPSRTPRPSLTPLPSRTPRPSLTPLPSRTPRPSLTPLPSRTPRPSLTALPSRTPRPSLTPLPSRTLRPSPTARPQQTLQPSETPESTPGQQPTLPPRPTLTSGPPSAATPTLDPGPGGPAPSPRPTQPHGTQ